MTRIEKLSNGMSIRAEGYSTRYSWGHKAYLYDEQERVVSEQKVTYYNRTWEAREYDTIISNLLSGFFDKESAEKYKVEVL